MLDVEVVVALPTPETETGDRAPGPLTEQRADVVDADHLLEDLPHVVRVGAVRRHEQLQTAHVHRVLARLGHQEQRIGR